MPNLLSDFDGLVELLFCSQAPDLTEFVEWLEAELARRDRLGFSETLPRKCVPAAIKFMVAFHNRFGVGEDETIPVVPVGAHAGD